MESITNQKIITGTIILAVLPPYLYFVTYMYEMGVCETLNIPVYLIEPSIGNVLSCGFTILIFFFFFMQIGNFILPLHAASKNPKYQHLKMILFSNALCILISGFILFTNPISWSICFIVIGIFFITNLVYWIFPILLKIKDKEHSTNEKLSQLTIYKNPYDAGRALLDKLSKYDRRIVLNSILLPLLCVFIGRGSILKQRKFDFVNNTNNTIVLRKYGDFLICGTIDIKKKVLTDSLVIIKMGDKDAVRLKTLDIGPLNIK